MIAPLGRGLGLALCMSALGGCSLLFEPGNEYLSSRPVLEAASAAAGYEVDASAYRLVRVEAERDAVTFHYRGALDARAEAWVLRFSPKPSEQAPTAIEDLYSHLSLIRDLRDGFALGEESLVEVRRARVRSAPYAFLAIERDGAGERLVAQGIVAVARAALASGDAIFVIRLERIGAEEALDADDISPFLDAIGK